MLFPLVNLDTKLRFFFQICKYLPHFFSNLVFFAIATNQIPHLFILSLYLAFTPENTPFSLKNEDFTLFFYILFANVIFFYTFASDFLCASYTRIRTRDVLYMGCTIAMHIRKQKDRPCRLNIRWQHGRNKYIATNKYIKTAENFLVDLFNILSPICACMQAKMY